MSLVLLAPDAWRAYRRDEFPAQSWSVEGDILHARAGVQPISLITRDRYRDFDLTLEPISIIRACATEVSWDAVLDGRRRRVLYVHKAIDGDEMRPNRPVPLGLSSNRCLLDLDRLRKDG